MATMHYFVLVVIQFLIFWPCFVLVVNLTNKWFGKQKSFMKFIVYVIMVAVICWLMTMASPYLNDAVKFVFGLF